MNFFSYKQLSQGRFICKLDLSLLYPGGLDEFWVRYDEFCKADPLLLKVIERKKNILIYPHESWIPELSNQRPKVLFLFGNPAPHSVFAGVYFAYEGSGREHRFWKVMRELGIIDMRLAGGQNISEKSLRSNFFKLKYKSPFAIGMEVLFTFPSPASDPRWSGVAGLQRLFGKKVFDRLAEAEQGRVDKLVKRFIGQKGKIIAFQKNAYNGMLKPGEDRYDLEKAVSGKLYTFCNDTVLLAGVPPTRWMHTVKFKKVLKKIMFPLDA